MKRKMCPQFGRGVIAAALVTVAGAGSAAAESVAPPPPTTALRASVALDEVFFVEVKAEKRRGENFSAEWRDLRKNLRATGARIEEVLTSSEKLYLKVRLTAANYEERNALLARLGADPSVAGVIAGASANFALKDAQKLERHGADAEVSENKLRGFREKRRDYKPTFNGAHSGEILVKYLEGESFTPAKREVTRSKLAMLHEKNRARVKKTHERKGGPIEVITLDAGADFKAALQSYAELEEVEYAQPNYRYHLLSTPNDPSYGSLWGMLKIQAPAAWDTRTSASSVTVAVIDTGIAYSHPDLAANMWTNQGEIPWNNIDDDGNGYVDDVHGASPVTGSGDPTDNYGHGTHVAGTIGAVGNNGIGVVGVAWSTKLMAIKVIDDFGYSDTDVLTDGIYYATAKGANVVNASIGNYDYDLQVAEAIAAFGAAGGIWINAAGNANTDNDASPNYPSGYALPCQVVVGASDSNDARATFSNTGRWSVDVFAPGVGVYSTVPANSYATYNGTSMASPHVAGLAALSRAQFPWENNREIADRLRFSTDRLAQFDASSMSGGRINAARALSDRPRISALSTRCQVNSGDALTIVGINVTGTGPKRVIFRAMGPTLTNYGVAGALPDTQIEVFTLAGTLIGANDNWQTLSAADQAEIAAAGLTPPHSLESAWVATLNPGLYTVHLRGVGGTTGVGIAEAYENDGSNVNRLVAVSTRCFVGSGSQTATTGVIVNGDKPRQVYIRALGPTLGSYGVSGAVSDTVLTLTTLSGTVLATNDDWQTFDGSGNALEKRVLLNGAPPVDSKESMIVMKLDPGFYTVQLTGKNGATGVGLIEVNEY